MRKMKMLRVNMPIRTLYVIIHLSRSGEIGVRASMSTPCLLKSYAGVTYVGSRGIHIDYVSPYKVTPNFDGPLLRESRQFKWAMAHMHGVLSRLNIDKKTLQRSIDAAVIR